MLWRPHHLIRVRTNFDFLGKRKIALVISTAINVASLVGVFVFGLNFGIDFEGGIAVQVRAKQGTVHLDQLRSTLGALGVGEVSLQEFGDASTALIRVQRAIYRADFILTMLVVKIKSCAFCGGLRLAPQVCQQGGRNQPTQDREEPPPRAISCCQAIFHG